jgi:hypothetical protein
VPERGEIIATMRPKLPEQRATGHGYEPDQRDEEDNAMRSICGGAHGTTGLIEIKTRRSGALAEKPPTLL